MASTWNRWLPAALIFALGIVAPRWLPAQGTGQTGTGTTGTGQTDTIGQITGSERFLRENRDPGQLVGGAGQGVGLQRGQTSSTGMGTSGMFGTQGGFNSMMGGFNSMNPMGSLYTAGLMNSLSRQRQQLRVPLRLGPDSFPFFPGTAAPVSTGPNLRVQNRLARIPQLKGGGSIKVEMQDKVAILRGQVQSQHDRDLVGRVVLLEPGVADVKNELQVVSAAKPSPQP